ncbi:MAG TPA: amidohydrolase family protein [Polyangium sp.]|jgi:imidazolonepropionase-like amidohydrolase|nr:amidohydrolase family protein [Polyangium sp.]
MSRWIRNSTITALAFVAMSWSGAAPAQVRPIPAKPPAAAPATSTQVAIAGGRVHTGTGEVIDDATILIENGVIQKVAKGLTVPANVPTLDARGSIVTPGFVDVMTSVGLVEVSQEDDTHADDQGGDDPIRAAFRAADGYNPSSVVIGITRAQGITSVGAVPIGGLFSGQSVWADLNGSTREETLVRAELALHVHIDENFDGAQGGAAGALLRTREAFDDARTFQKNKGAWERNQSRPFAASRLDLEAIGNALAGKIPVVFHVQRASDILATLALAKEFNLRPILFGAAEGWKVAKQIAAAKVPVIVYAIVPGPTSFDQLGARDDNAALLHAAGVSVILTSNETHNARKLRQIVGNAVRAGLPHEAAIASVTRAPAEAFGLATQYGTIAPGKTANIVVWSADPFETTTYPKSVVIRGHNVDLTNRQTMLLNRYRKLPATR